MNLPVSNRVAGIFLAALYLVSGAWATANGAMSSELFLFFAGIVIGGLLVALIMQVFILPNVEPATGTEAEG